MVCEVREGSGGEDDEHAGRVSLAGPVGRSESCQRQYECPTGEPERRDGPLGGTCATGEPLELDELLSDFFPRAPVASSGRSACDRLLLEAWLVGEGGLKGRQAGVLMQPPPHGGCTARPPLSAGVGSLEGRGVFSLEDLEDGDEFCEVGRCRVDLLGGERCFGSGRRRRRQRVQDEWFLRRDQLVSALRRVPVL